MRIAAGELDRTVMIYAADMKDDGTATVAGEPIFVGKRSARKIDVSDGERMRAAQNGDQLITRFLVRADSLTRTINGTHVLECRGAWFEVSAAKESGERENGIEITAVTRPDMAAA
jgi:hypothetical protein